MADLHHRLDQYLSEAGWGFARCDHQGRLVFDSEQGVPMVACRDAPDRIRVFASPGQISAVALSRLSARLGGAGPLSVGSELSWREGEAEWTLSIDPADGVVTLSLLLSDVPRQCAHWARHLERFDAEFLRWRQRLHPREPH